MKEGIRLAKVTLEVLDELESKIRQGDHSNVREFLRNTSRSEIPDRLIVKLCQLARRIDYAKKGIIILRERIMNLPPQVRPDPYEVVEYAACMLKLGGITECRKLLSGIEAHSIPDVYKYTAFTYVHQWDYRSALPLLKSYIEHPRVSDYDRLVGSLNFAAALIAVEEYQQAVGVLMPLRERAERNGFKLVLGNIYELLAQTQIHMRRFAEANEYVAQAWSILKVAQPRYRIYLEKWRAVAALLQDPKDGSALKNLRRVRLEAIERCEWETIRECDFHESMICQDRAMFLRLYFGTPHQPYREMMLRRDGGRTTIPESYVWGTSEQTLDVEFGSVADKQIFKKGLGQHRLFSSLVSDFYAPTTVPQLFSLSFENEGFHPETSAPRIYELIRRIKIELNRSKIELPIHPTKGGYKLDIQNANCGLLVRPDRQLSGGILATIHSLYGDSEFRLRELCEQTRIPHTSLYRQVKQLVTDGKVTVVGHGKQSRYKAA
jgi:tetratricopeptide (TPR) repeat protein